MDSNHVLALLRGDFPNICRTCGAKAYMDRKKREKAEAQAKIIRERIAAKPKTTKADRYPDGVLREGENYRDERINGKRHWFARCSSEYHEGERWREVSRPAYEVVHRGKSDGFCVSCAQKEIGNAPPIPNGPSNKERRYVDRWTTITCECGNERELLVRTLQCYRAKGITPKCPNCSQSHKAVWQHPVDKSLPCRRAPEHHRCHAAWLGCEDYCEHYDACLTRAVASGWSGWVCSLQHDMTYATPINELREDLLIAMEHSVKHGFLPDANSSEWLVLR